MYLNACRDYDAFAARRRNRPRSEKKSSCSLPPGPWPIFVKNTDFWTVKPNSLFLPPKSYGPTLPIPYASGCPPKKGNGWAGPCFLALTGREAGSGVVQSLHVIQGGEFARLARDASVLPAGWTIGGPLIRDEADFGEMIDFIRELRHRFSEVDCLMLVGHGAKRPHGLIYEKLAERIRDEFGRAVLFGSLTGRPERSKVMRIIEDERFKTVRLTPFLFSVGWHAQNDIMNGERSWRRELEARG